jgi:hypothetical protein
VNLLLLLSLSIPAARAADGDVSSAKLAAKQPFDLSAVNAVKVGTETCTVKPAAAPADNTLPTCKALYGALASGTTVKVVPADKDGKDLPERSLRWATRTGAQSGTAASINSNLAVEFGADAGPSGTALLAIPGEGFYPLPKSGSTYSVDAATDALIKARGAACDAKTATDCTLRVRAFADAAEGGEWTITVGTTAEDAAAAKAKAKAEAAATAKAEAKAQKEAKAKADANTCEKLVEANKKSGADLLCVDVTGASIREKSSLADRLLFPNRSLTVVVRHYTTDTIEVAVSGLRGTTDLGYDVPSMGNEGVTAEAESGENVVPDTITLTELSFAPRKPGTSVDVTISKNGKTVRTSELEVVAAYIGAVRLGIAGGTAVEQTYGTAMAPGSDQSEVVLTSGATTMFQPELVVGFAPFLFTPRGRSYVTTRDVIHPKYLAPFVGLGVATLDSTSTVKFSLLKSVYLGVEYEMGRHASIGVAGQLRQVSRLTEPYVVGGAIDGTTVPTTFDYSPGIAVFFNVSPDFFRVVQPLAK